VKVEDPPVPLTRLPDRRSEPRQGRRTGIKSFVEEFKAKHVVYEEEAA